MIYSYRCAGGHTQEAEYRIGQQAPFLPCTGCSGWADRDFEADFAGVTIAPVDPFRSFDLSSKKSEVENTQQRRLDAPRDNFERKHLEKTYGRMYVGNDYSSLRPESRAAIEKGGQS